MSTVQSQGFGYDSALVPIFGIVTNGRFTMPLWLALMAWLFQGQRLSPRLLLALALGGAAVAFLMVPSFKAYANAPLGMALGLLGGVGWAVGTLLIKRWPVPVHAAVSTGWQLLLTAPDLNTTVELKPLQTPLAKRACSSNGPSDAQG